MTGAPGPEFKIEFDGATLERFFVSSARVRLIQGPRGSGKSNLCCKALFFEATRQAPGRDGIRHTRYYAVRNTYDELKRTTVETWLMNFPESAYGRFVWGKPFEHRIRVGDVDMHVLFLALDRPEDVRKLLSAEASGFWLNEFREIPREVLDEADGPLGRYPSKDDGGCTRPMIVADTNAPPEQHWFAMMSGQTKVPKDWSEEQRRVVTKPDNWEIFIQPPAAFEVKDAEQRVVGYEPNPKAENLRNLPAGYYQNLTAGKTVAFIKVNVLNRPGADVSGKPVWPQAREEVHVSREPLKPVPGHPLLVGVDFGRTPAAVIGQNVFARWFLLHELLALDMGARRFAQILKAELAQVFPGYGYTIFGDPAGEHLAEADDVSPFIMFRAAGLAIQPAPTNDWTIRKEAVEHLLTSMVDGRPTLLISSSCINLKEAVLGGYRYRKMQILGADRYAPTPEKDEHSHPAEALQYLVLGGGAGLALARPNGGAAMPKPTVAPRTFSVMDRRGGRFAAARRLGR